VLAAGERPDRLDRDVGGEHKEARGDQLLSPTLSCGRANASAGEEPEHDEAGERLDQRVSAEADKRDRAGRDPGAQRNRELDEVIGDPAPGEQSRLALEPLALG
jgi:hypothetical protein